MSIFLAQLDRVWTAYPDDVQQALYQAYMDGTKVVELVMQSDPTIKYMRFYSKYFIDFNDMKQYNAYTNKTRKIKLVDGEGTQAPQLKGKLAKIVATTCVPNKEKYTVEETAEEEKQMSDDCALILTRMNNVWLTYGPDVHVALQKAYCAGYAMVEFVVLSDPGVEHMKYYSKYVVDFTAMTQYNVYTEKSRKIRFVSKQDKDKDIY